MKLPEMGRETVACLQCGYCIPVCDTYRQTPWESVTPRGKVFFLKQLKDRSPVDTLLGRKVVVDDEFVDALYRCTVCAACWPVCHVSIDFLRYWERVRRWVVEQGKGPMPAHKKFHSRICQLRNPYGEKTETRGDWASGLHVSDDPDVILFAGCTASYRVQNIARCGLEVLGAAGMKVGILGEEEWCCTSPALRVGYTDITHEFAKHQVELMEAKGISEMVTTCAGCYKTMREDFPEFYSRPTFRMKHFAQLAHELIRARRLALKGEFNATVAYHDPCHLGRHAGVFEPPREVLRRIPGVRLVEFKRNRMDSQCCGAGGGYKSQYGDLAVNVAASRVRQALDAGADTIVTCCPFCVVNMSDAVEREGGFNIRVMDLSEILAEVV